MNELVIKMWNKRSFRTTLIIIFGIMALVSLIQGVRNAISFSQDFQWDACKVLALGINPYDESLNPTGCLDFYGFDKYYLQMEANQFPSLLMLLLPFSFLEPLSARYAWIVCNLLFTMGIFILLRKTFLKEMSSEFFVFNMLLCIAGTPYRNQLGVGQHTLFSFFFFLLAVYFEEKKGTKITGSVGMILSLFVCYFKYTLTVPLCLYFVYKKRYKEIVVSALMHVLLTFVAAYRLNDSFINMIIKPLKVSSALSAEGGLDFGALFGGSNIAYVFLAIIMIVLLLLAFLIDGNMEKEYFSVLLLWSLIIIYHRTYDFFVLSAAVAFFLGVDKKSYLKWLYGITVAAVYFVLRLFNEALISKICVGAIYYLLTLAITGYIVWGASKKLKAIHK